MPTYVYEYLGKDGKGTGECFELVQSMKDEPLTTHDGRAVHRVPQAPNIAGDWSDVKSKGKLSNKNLERLGFTKYEKRGDGVMERVAGKEGPRVLKADD
jgi:Uncharacterized protein conserved in bacteria